MLKIYIYALILSLISDSYKLQLFDKHAFLCYYRNAKRRKIYRGGERTRTAQKRLK